MRSLSLTPKEAKASPKRKLTVACSLIATLILLSPFVSTSLVAAKAFGSSQASADLLAIDSETLDISMLPLADDGFLMKRGTALIATDKTGLSEAFTYRIAEGDTLSAIAKRFGVSTDTLIWENEGLSPHSLKVGTEIRILPVSGVSYRVAANESLDAIAKKFSVSKDDILKQNGISADQPLADRTIIIPGAEKKAPPSLIAAASTKKATSKTAKGGSYSAKGVSTDSPTGGKWMIKPTSGIYTTYFQKGHYAVDIANRSKPAIYAAAGGTVERSQCGWNGGYGCMIIIDHGNGVKTLYAHLSSLGVKAGDTVSQGSEIAVMGHTGRVYGATGIHLHFEVVDNGKKKNPLAYY